MSVTGTLTYKISEILPVGVNPDPARRPWFNATDSFMEQFQGRQGVVITFGGSNNMFNIAIRALAGKTRAVIMDGGESAVDVQRRAVAAGDAVVADFTARLAATGNPTDERNILTIASEIGREYKLSSSPWQDLKSRS
jgi:hypothetical protein